MEEMLSPGGGCALSGTQPLQVVVKNIGGLPQTNFNIAYSLNDGPVTTQAISTSKLPNINDTLHYTFPVPVDFSATGLYHFAVYTLLGPDLYRPNDTLRATVENSRWWVRRAIPCRWTALWVLRLPSRFSGRRAPTPHNTICLSGKTAIR
ncbi:MAG: hypothetical protein IPM98_15670 [Lewinellaceae bacterium]|nr:hypothetical protein [Lewinellaceae bacterium]